MLVVEIVFLSESILLHMVKWKAAPQKILISWFMLKPFIEKERDMQLQPDKKILTNQHGRLQQQK